MKKTLLAALAAVGCTAAMQAESPLWLRMPSISPDGQTIAFTYKGDIFTVPSSGGEARRITSAGGYNANPVWSPDGSLIAFSSNREGSDDVFVVDATGGTPRRVTTNSAGEVPRAFLDDTTIIFDANLAPSRETAGGPFQTQTYAVDVNGGRPHMLMSLPTLAMDVNAAGDILYRDRKGYEDPLRKHERSSGTSDIWLLRDGNFKKLTDFNGQDTDPAWGAADTFYYVSEEGNDNLNVFVCNIDGTGKRQLTAFEHHPVRSLSASRDGSVLAFSQDGELYTLRPGSEPQKVQVSITADEYDSDRVKRYVTSGASNLTVAPSGEEVALIIRGDLYVTSSKYKTTKRITDTAGQERVMSFAPDGRSIVYDSERDGKWQLFISKIKNPDEKNFTYCTEIEETPLYSCATTAQQPAFSPDGKKVAFLENRTELKVIDVDTKKAVTALDGKYNYSYSDGDVEFEWSPDSRWLIATYIGVGGWNNRDVVLVKADGSEVIDLTESGYTEDSPQWALDGRGITYASGRYGYKNQASWGEQQDIFLMMLDGEAWDEFNRTEEEQALADKEKENAEKDEKKDDKKKDDKKKKEAKKADEKKPLEFDLANRKYRTRRLTTESGFLGNYYLDKKGENLYYLMQNADGKYNIMKRDLKKGDTKVFASDIRGGFEADKKGENIFVLSGGDIQKISLKGGETEAVPFEALYTRTPSAEREYIYDHMLSQVRDKFYDETLHGVDWDFYGKEYRKFLPYIDNNADFATLLSEILGELNASHTGGRYRGPGAQLTTASLGAFYEEDYKGDGLKIAEVVARGPLATKKASVKAGDIITSIDGTEIKAGEDFYPLLEGKSGKKVRLGIRQADGKTRSVEVKPISQGRFSDLLYDRWVERNQAIADSVSGGRIAYVHVQGMDSESYRKVYEELLGKYRNCDAVVVDTRFNGGGWLHNDLIILLSGKEYVQYSPRGRYIGSEPWSQWNKPSVMLVNEGNYSDAHGTPTAYQTLGVGEIVGAPVPGTMTAVWWENQIDPTLIFGIPQVTNLVNGVAMENHQLNPDVLVYNEPAKMLAGEDQQLIAAIKRLMQKTAK